MSKRLGPIAACGKWGNMPSTADVASLRATSIGEHYEGAVCLSRSRRNIFSDFGGGTSSVTDTCLEIEDQSKERLDCYDEKAAPAPKQVSAPAKKVEDCRFVKEDGRAS